MNKDNKLEQKAYNKYYELKDYLGRLQDEYQICHIRYMNETDKWQRTKVKRDLDDISLRIRRTQQEMDKIKNLIHLKDSMDILKLSGFMTDAEEQWITVNGAHVKIEEGQSKGEAVRKFINNTHKSKETKEHMNSRFNSSEDLWETLTPEEREWLEDNLDEEELEDMTREEIIETLKKDFYDFEDEDDDFEDEDDDFEDEDDDFEDEDDDFEDEDDDFEDDFTEDEGPDTKYKNFMAGKKKPLTYSESKDGGPGSGIKGHTTSRSGYKMEDPGEIEAAIKRVKASGHPNPQYLAALERALVVAKRERGMKDSCGEKVYTKGHTGDGGPGSGIKGHTTPKESNSHIVQKLKGPDKANLSNISKNWSKATIEHIIKNASVFKPEVVEEAKRLSKIVKDDCFNKDFRVSLDLRHQDVDYEKAKQLAMKKEQELKNKYKDVKLVMKTPTNTYFEWEVKDADPKVAEAEAMINLFGGVM